MKRSLLKATYSLGILLALSTGQSAWAEFVTPPRASEGSLKRQIDDHAAGIPTSSQSVPSGRERELDKDSIDQKKYQELVEALKAKKEISIDGKKISGEKLEKLVKWVTTLEKFRDSLRDCADDSHASKFGRWIDTYLYSIWRGISEGKVDSLFAKEVVDQLESILKARGEKAEAFASTTDEEFSTQMKNTVKEIFGEVAVARHTAVTPFDTATQSIKDAIKKEKESGKEACPVKKESKTSPLKKTKGGDKGDEQKEDDGGTKGGQGNTPITPKPAPGTGGNPPGTPSAPVVPPVAPPPVGPPVVPPVAGPPVGPPAVEQAAGAPFDINALADAFKQRLKDLQDQLAQDRAKNDAALRAALDAIQRQQAAEDFNNNNDRNNQIDPNLLARDNNRNDQPVIPPPAIPPVTIPPSDNNDNQAPLPEAKNDEEDEDPGFTPPPMFPQPPPPTTPPIVIGDTQPRFSDSSADRRRDRDSSLLPSQLNTTNAGILEELRLRNALAFAQQQAPYVNGRPNVGTSMAARLSGASGARPVGTGRAPFGGSTNLGTAGQLANGPAGARTNVPSAISNGDRRL